MLNKQNISTQSITPLIISVTITSSQGPGVNGQGGDDSAGNPVGELQEMTQKRLWPPPIYDFTNEQGPPHAREFICTVRLQNLEEKGKEVQTWICCRPDPKQVHVNSVSRHCVSSQISTGIRYKYE